MRFLKPEILLLSDYRIGPDSIVFGTDAEHLAVFENSPVATSSILELRPSVNDLIYNYVSDVKLILYYEAFYDPDLKPLVLEELAERQPLTGRRSVALRYELFDEFFAFQDTGAVSFTLRSTMLPFYHQDPRIDELTLLVGTDEGVSPGGLSVTSTAGDGTAATQVTSADGAASSGGTPLDAFLGHDLLQDWTVTLPVADNQARFDAGFAWSQVRDIVLVVEYSFTPLRIEDEPFVLLRDDFDSDPLADFDVVDDVGAGTNTPSAWSHDTVNGRVEQHSAIFGEPGGPPNGADKPGTYLIRKATASVPAAENFLLVAGLSSSTADGIGLVFRWQDQDNFYFFLMDGQRSYRRLGKKVGGVFQELDVGAVDLANGYAADDEISVRVRVKGDSLSVFLDGSLVLSGTDTSLPSAGRVGFYSWANVDARFDGVQLIEI